MTALVPYRTVDRVPVGRSGYSANSVNTVLRRPPRLSLLALDRAPSNRSYTPDGFMVVRDCVLTREGISEYSSAEIPDANKLGLTPNTMYRLYRPGSELRKSVTAYANLRSSSSTSRSMLTTSPRN